MKDFQQAEYKNTYRILTGRLLIIGFALGASILQNAETVLDNFPNKIIYKLFIVYSLISLFYYLVVKIFPVQRTFIFFQLIIDIFVVTLFSSMTGLTDSIFNYLFFIIVIAGSLYLSATQGLLLAIIGSLSISSITYIAHENIIRIFPEYLEYSDIISAPLQTLFAKMATFAFGLIVVALLSGYLSNRIKQEGILITEILANLSNGVLVIDLQNKIYYINTEICQLFNLKEDPKSYIGMSFSDFSNLAQCPKIEEINQLKSSETHECDYKSNQMDLLLEIRSVPIYMRKNRVKALIFIITDRTIQRELHDISLRAQRLGIVNDLASNIVHEIRNPIAGISGAIHEVKNSKGLDEFDKKLLDIVSHESDRLNDIVTHFLEYSRLQSNLNQKCNLTQLFKDLVIMLQVNPNADKIQFLIDSPEDVNCRGDYNQLQQAFLNLVLNSVEMQQNQGTIILTIQIHNVAQLNSQARSFFSKVPAIIEVSVQDQGPGIPAAIKDKIFDPFFTTKASGTGLGLSIVQKIVESHGGLIQLQTETDKGTTFKIFLHPF